MMKTPLFLIALFIFLSGDLCADPPVIFLKSTSPIKNKIPSIPSIKIQKLSNKRLYDIDIKMHDQTANLFAQSIEVNVSQKLAQSVKLKEQCFKSFLLEKSC